MADNQCNKAILKSQEWKFQPGSLLQTSLPQFEINELCLVFGQIPDPFILASSLSRIWILVSSSCQEKSSYCGCVHSILLSTISVYCVRQYFVSELLTYKTQCVLMITVLDQGWRDLSSIPTPPSKLSEWPWGRSVRSSLIGSTSAEGEDIQSSSSWSQQLHSSAAGEKKNAGTIAITLMVQYHS